MQTCLKIRVLSQDLSKKGHLMCGLLEFKNEFSNKKSLYCNSKIIKKSSVGISNLSCLKKICQTNIKNKTNLPNKYYKMSDQSRNYNIMSPTPQKKNSKFRKQNHKLKKKKITAPK